ncbi:MAG: archaeosortase/exosortase family protein [Candidatus Paceibacterales bacterium]
MDITEQRRAAGREADPKAKAPENKPAPQIIENTNSRVKEENVKEIKSENSIPTIAIIRSLAFILSLIAILFIVSSKFSEPWVNIVAANLNALIVYGSFFVLNIIQGACTVDGLVLITHYYKISLQGDWVALYSLELLVIFAVLFVFFQKITRIKRGVVFMSLIPLAIVANIFRVVMACGLALNYGPAFADRYFHGVLAGSVFVIIILGLIFLEFLSSPE